MRRGSLVFPLIALSSAFSIGRAQKSATSEAKSVTRMTLRSKKGQPADGYLVYFDRIKSKNQIINPPPSNKVPLANIASVIAGSSALVSGTVFIAAAPTPGCWARDWNIAVLSEETSNVINYHAGDVSVSCIPTDTKPAPPANPSQPPPRPLADDANKSLKTPQTLYVVLPVKAVWVEITGFHGDLNDPARKAPTQAFSALPICYSHPKDDQARAIKTDNTKPDGTHADDTDIRPCDLNQNALRALFYKSGWIYNRLTAPGVWAGSFSISPVVVKQGTQSITEDIRFYGSSKEGPGWLGLNAMFEKAPTVTSNLNSLTGSIVYDFHLSNRSWWVAPWKGERSGPPIAADANPITLEIDQPPAGVGIRPGELSIASGEEYAPTRTKATDGMHLEKDLNFVESIYYKQPFSVTAFKFPSFMTLFPTIGAEGGWHLIRYQSKESAQFFRKVAGVDASVRYPFQLAPNFTSTKPATIDFSFRERFLSGCEPYTGAYPAGTPASQIMPALSRQKRSYYRISLNWPLSSYVALTTSVQRGSLPPDFNSVAWTLTAGLSFGSTGTSEH